LVDYRDKVEGSIGISGPVTRIPLQNKRIAELLVRRRGTVAKDAFFDRRF
jgi:hypothetical protein